MFHIKYYWLRYEFAPSRGQIHAHILVIHDNPKVMEPYYSNIGNKKKQEEFLHKWMTEELGMTASFPETSPIPENESHPSRFAYNEIQKKVTEIFSVVYRNCSTINAVLFA